MAAQLEEDSLLSPITAAAGRSESTTLLVAKVSRQSPGLADGTDGIRQQPEGTAFLASGPCALPVAREFSESHIPGPGHASAIQIRVNDDDILESTSMMIMN